MAHDADPDPNPASLGLPDADHQQLSAARWLRLAAPHPVDEGGSALGLACAGALWMRVRSLIDSELTERQRQVLELYFLKGLDQAAVATLLGLTQQSVSEHLFGKARNGRHVGGLVRKLRKLCAARGIAPGGRLRTEPSEPLAFASASAQEME